MSNENLFQEPEKKQTLGGKILRFFLKSPIHTLFFFALCYFAIRAYLISPSFENKLAMFAILGGWIFWFLAKQIFIILIVLGLLAGGGYLYYQYSHLEQKKCEESGRYWNKENKTCEENVPFAEKAKRFIKKIVIDKDYNISIFNKSKDSQNDTQQDKGEK